ncbi:MAG TPA: LysM peptidoglycan-binding domain-containing protein [Solirubrobacteraceae bacterium]|nr:LysM peptidoglycan-binding domain-containing protein [Solirubrobacteraceae bacterium]
MRPRRLLLFCIALLIPAAPASAAVPHTVQPGETLWSIAAANNLTTRTVAAYNGLSEDAQVVLGSTINVPTATEGYAALQNAGLVSSTPASSAPATAPSGGGSYVVQAGDTLTAIAGRAGVSVSSLAAANGLDPAGVLLAGTSLKLAGSAAPAASSAPASSGAPAAQGAYKVRAGDTLGDLARQTGVSVDAMAAMNGLDPSGVLLTGTVLKLPTGAPAPEHASEPEPTQTVVPTAAPEPTAQSLGAADIQNIAAAHGVSPSLAAAIAWQESGFNNSMVSGANARGIMQVMPGTWDYVQQNLAGGQSLDPNSATDNVHAGVIYLKRLIDDAGGDENAAIAGYYQGLSSVQSRGMFDDTKRYVDNVQALRSRFGG